MKIPHKTANIASVKPLFKSCAKFKTIHFHCPELDRLEKIPKMESKLKPVTLFQHLLLAQYSLFTVENAVI